MITAEKVSKLSTLKAKDLDTALKNAGYSAYERPMDCTFLGITTGGDFCYKFIYRDSTEDTWAYGKLFVNINATGLVIAEY
jgi:hypothetical protein